jgi:hypothetical protein
MPAVASSRRDDEKIPLLCDAHQDAPALPSADARSITIGFYLMAVCFSVNHGTVTGGSARLQAPRHLTPHTSHLTSHNHNCSHTFNSLIPFCGMRHALKTRLFLALLSLASVNLGLDLGGYSSGALYAAYTVSAATVAAYGACHVFLILFTLNP